jgi:hypothetical protein
MSNGEEQVRQQIEQVQEVIGDHAGSRTIRNMESIA